MQENRLWLPAGERRSAEPAMNEIWGLPTQVKIRGILRKFHGDYRDILEIFSYLEDPDMPDFIKWRVAIGLFYEEELPEQDLREGAEYLASFIRCGQPEQPGASGKLLDWQQDAPAIISDINRVAGTEIRSLPFLHWWTFMALFHSIGEGQLSAILTLRKKLKSGKKLEKWEQDFYRENADRIHLHSRYTQAERQEREKLLAMLGESSQERSGRTQ